MKRVCIHHSQVLQVARCAPDHQKSMDLVRNLQSVHPQADAIFQGIQGFLRSQGSAGPIHTIFCLDDSGSMTSSWPSVHPAICFRAFNSPQTQLSHFNRLKLQLPSNTLRLSYCVAAERSSFRLCRPYQVLFKQASKSQLCS